MQWPIIKVSKSSLEAKIWYALEIKRNGAHDVLVGRKTLVDDVCVVYDISAEKEATSNGENEIHGAAEWHEDAN